MLRWTMVILAMAAVLIALRYRPAPEMLLVAAAVVIVGAVIYESRQRIARAARARYALIQTRAATTDALDGIDAALLRLNARTDVPTETRTAFVRALHALRTLDAAIRNDPDKALHAEEVRGLAERVSSLVRGYDAMRALDADVAREAVAATDAQAAAIAIKIQDAVSDLMRGDAERLRVLGQLLAEDRDEAELRSFADRLAAS